MVTHSTESPTSLIIKWRLCTYWLGGRAGRENIWPEVMAYGPSAMTEGQIFSRPARPNSVNKHFIIWPPRFSFFPFFFYFFFFRVTKFGMLIILTEKSGFIQQQSCFSSLLARAIDKIPVWGPYAILAGPDGFFRTCSRHHVRPSYGDFLNSFAMKARAGPYGSYNKWSSHLLDNLSNCLMNLKNSGDSTGFEPMTIWYLHLISNTALHITFLL